MLIITGQYHLRALRWGVGGRWGGGRVISLVRSALGEGGDNTGQHHGDLGTVLCRRVVITLVSIMATLGQWFGGRVLSPAGIMASLAQCFACVGGGGFYYWSTSRLLGSATHRDMSGMPY